MSKLIKHRNRGNFTLKFTNGRRVKFRTAEAYSNATERLAKGRFRGVGAMYAAVKTLPTGFEYVESERKSKSLEKRFNGIEFDD